MIAEKDITIEQAISWLQAEAVKKGIKAQFLRGRAEIRPRQHYTFIRIPVIVENDPDGTDEIRLITALESAWNFSDPMPEKMLSLIPAWAPEDA